VTTPHPFAALVRRLDAEATSAPWHTGSETTRISGYNFALVRPSHRPGEQSVALVPSEGFDCANARAIVTLRNAAPEVAALVEAVEAYREAGRRYDACVHTYPGGDSLAQADRAETAARVAMFAALDALRVVATQAKEAKS
jgi:arginine/ornithine N-succinyltransferase beta subunit